MESKALNNQVGRSSLSDNNLYIMKRPHIDDIMLSSSSPIDIVWAVTCVKGIDHHEIYNKFPYHKRNAGNNRLEVDVLDRLGIKREKGQ